MFDTKGFFKALTVPLLYVIIMGVILGLAGMLDSNIMSIIFYFPSIIAIGIAAPYWNVRTPYFASFFTTVTYIALNHIVSQYLLGFESLADPVKVNQGLTHSIIPSLLITFIFQRVRKKLNNHKSTDNINLDERNAPYV